MNERIKELAKEYHSRLMKALDKATNQHDMTLSVHEDSFILTGDEGHWELSSTYDKSSGALDLLEWFLLEAEKQRLEVARRRSLKQSALAKLSDEERAVLGL